jgi:hypothetical protein
VVAYYPGSWRLAVWWPDHDFLPNQETYLVGRTIQERQKLKKAMSTVIQITV